MLEEAAREVFELMLGCRLTLAEAGAREAGARKDVSEPALNIAAMVGLAGELSGVMSIRCTSKSAAMMASMMLGVEPDHINDEIYDALGEICNMVAGNFKNKIPGLGDGCLLSVPTVIIGDDYRVHPPAGSPVLEVHMLYEDMAVVISLKVHD